MQRQRSILSFLSKPPPATAGSSKLNPGGLRNPQSVGAPDVRRLPEDEVRGTDTPEKCAGTTLSGSVGSIMRRLERTPGSATEGSTHLSCPNTNVKEHRVGDTTPLECLKSSKLLQSKVLSSEDNLFMELDFDNLGPETPAMRPVMPCLRQAQEVPTMQAQRASCNTKISAVKTVLNIDPCTHLSKRAKLQDCSPIKDKLNDNDTETIKSKFEWLDPSRIKDAKGRQPSDPLYDRRTLHIPPDELKKMSASQKQYWSIKCQYMDVVLFFKVGKFYELYEFDAEIGQKELDWKMTVSGVGKCRQVGISEAGIDEAVLKLTARGYKVGRIEQVETADQAKARGASSVIQRKLVHVASPSTVVDGNIGPEAVQLLALKEDNKAADGSTKFGFAFVDCAALKFWVGSICDDHTCAALGALLVQVSPKEIIYESAGLSHETQTALRKYASSGSIRMQLTSVPGLEFSDASQTQKSVNSNGYFKTSSQSWLSAFDSSSDQDLAICALGGLIQHLTRLMLEDALRNGEVFPYHVYSTCLRMDGQTLINLEIFSNNINGGLSGTLHKYLNHCATASGKRLLRRWICHPLKDINDINYRLDITEGLVNNSGVLAIILGYLRRIPDLERLLGRVKSSVGSACELLLPSIGKKMLKQRIKVFGTLVKGFRTGIDLLYDLRRDDHGIPSLSKIVNIPTISSLGELIHQFEVALDDEFPQYQNHDVKDSDMETLAILVELFIGKASEWSQVIDALSSIDVLQSFATSAISSCGSTSRPKFLLKDSNSQTGPVLRMRGLWHPYAVAERESGVVPNDISLGQELTGNSTCALLLTGPNMGGKSTLMRATCLAVVLAQLGCYVPCESCELTPVDTLFTRLGATDRIMSGESTFYVECAETASVLKNATINSLVLLDELGRGTSTFDGYAIAYAVFRHLVEKVCCRLLFATHYHPLTKEFASHPHVSLRHMACIFKPKVDSGSDNELIFLYKLAPGACPESYGLQVALMAGVEPPIVEAASKAGRRMRSKIAGSFQSSESRAAFSTLHEDWLKALLAVSDAPADGSGWDEDSTDTLLCLWHELRSHRS